MAWSADNGATQLTSINGTTEQYFDDVFTLGPGEVAHCQVHVALGGAPGTDNARVSVYATLDASSETWDEAPLQRYLVTQEGPLDDKWFSFTISGVYKARVGVISTGATNTHTADMNSRQDGVSL